MTSSEAVSVDPERAQEAAPWLHTSGGPTSEPTGDMSGRHFSLPDIGMVDSVSTPLWRDGFFTVRPCITGAGIDALARGVTALRSAGLPAVVIFLFDEAWDLARAVSPVARYLLGEQARLLPHLWAWHVGPGGTPSGWPPHKDASGTTVLRAGDMDLLMSLSIWIPLTAATPENGCMSVLPMDVEPTDTRARPIVLPAPPGSLLGWRQDLWHWGNAARPVARAPRISLAFEFQAAFLDPPLADGLIDPDQPPRPRDRPALVDAQIAKYRHMENDQRTGGHDPS